MAKRVRDSSLESRAARAKLAPRARPYFKAIGPGLHLGYRRGKNGGRWVVRLYIGDGAYRVETLADADDMLDADGASILSFWEAQGAARSLHVASAEKAASTAPYTVRDALADYLEWMDGARKSASDARYRADALILPHLGDMEVAKLTAGQIRTWLREVAEAPPRLRTRPGEDQRHRELTGDPEERRRRRASANRTMSVLKAALNRAWREGKAASDAEWRRVEPFEAVEAARVRYLTIAEARRLANACEPAFRALVQAALQTGARYGELAALTVSDFNPDAGTIHVRTSKAGKARHVVLTDEGRDLFASLTAGRASTDLILSMPSGAPWGKSCQRRPMLEACERAKISPAVGFHQLRHTWASHAVMNAVPLLVVAKNLGHSDTRMVEKHYGHLAPSYIADAIRAGAPRFGTDAGNVVPIEAGA